MLVRLSHATLSFLDMLHLEFERSLVVKRRRDLEYHPHAKDRLAGFRTPAKP
jgi:hypothetical protein